MARGSRVMFRAYLAATMLFGAWIARRDQAPASQVVASAVLAPAVVPAALVHVLAVSAFER